MTDKEKLAIGITGSLVVHLLVVLCMMLWSSLSKYLPEPKKVKREEAPLELVLDPELAHRLQAAAPPPMPERLVIDTAGLRETDKVPENARFESDKNSELSSARDPTGSAAAPSQEGRDSALPQFQNRRALDGQITAAPAVPSLPQPSEPAPAKPPAATPPPLARPTPVAAEPTPMLAKATPSPAPTVKPLIVPTPAPGQLGVLPRPTPRTAAAATPSPTPKPTPTEVAALSQPPPRPPSAPGYQAGKEQTRIEGNLSNRNESGLDSKATPLGRYQKVLADAIGSRWNYYVLRHMDMIEVGSVQVHFFVSRDGRASQVTVRDSTSNTAFESYCVQAITAADIPPIPPDVVPVLEQNRLEITYTFTIYPN